MNKIKWVDRNNMMACIEAGIIGKDMERELSKFGVCCGHEPDSIEFSSLGGWVSTRASGMKKNKYGNIDDILVGIKIATPIGTIQKVQNAPRISSGPDIHEFILGHEGNFGIITECILKIRPIPEAHIYESIIFHEFDLGIKFMYEGIYNFTQFRSQRFGRLVCVLWITNSFSSAWLSKLRIKTNGRK